MKPTGTYNEIKDNPALKFEENPDFGFFALYFNQRKGSLFADKARYAAAQRRAMQKDFSWTKAVTAYEQLYAEAL